MKYDTNERVWMNNAEKSFCRCAKGYFNYTCDCVPFSVGDGGKTIFNSLVGEYGNSLFYDDFRLCVGFVFSEKGN